MNEYSTLAKQGLTAEAIAEMITDDADLVEAVAEEVAAAIKEDVED